MGRQGLNDTRELQVHRDSDDIRWSTALRQDHLEQVNWLDRLDSEQDIPFFLKPQAA